ncbi:MAG: hypothetical protein KO463_05330 [Candidatus Methanofastidiosa archaeon]|nr:hypothetical protein [Candidatus Methanofastidiosa archaeon]
MIESLLEIKNAEEQAASIVESAKGELKRMVEEANRKRDDILSTTIKQTEAEIKKLKQLYYSQGQNESRIIVQDGEKELEDIATTAEASFSQAVDAVVKSVIE